MREEQELIVITDTEKQIVEDAEAKLLRASCPNVARVLIQRGMGLHLLSLSGEALREEKRRILRFVEEAYLVQ